MNTVTKTRIIKGEKSTRKGSMNRQPRVDEVFVNSHSVGTYRAKTLELTGKYRVLRGVWFGTWKGIKSQLETVSMPS